MDCRKWREKYSTDCRLKYNSLATQKNYTSCVVQFLNFFEKKYREPKEIPTQDIKDWLLMATTINTRKHRLCAIKSFYKITLGMPAKIDRIPFPLAEKKLPIVLSKDEVNSMFKACENMKHKAVLAVLYSAGLRVSELINLKWQHLDRARGVINIIHAKGNKDRQVPLPASLIRVLEEYYLSYKSKVYVFNGQVDPQYSQQSVLQVVKQLAHKAGINKKVWTHLLRHCAFTHMVEAGTDINLIQVLAGHSSPKTTRIYTHLSHNLISRIPSPLSELNL